MIYSDQPESENEKIRTILKRAKSLRGEYVRVTYWQAGVILYPAQSEGILTSVTGRMIRLYRVNKQNRGILIQNILAIEEARP